MKEIKSKEIIFNHRIIWLTFIFLFALTILIFVDESVVTFFVALPLMIISMFLILVSPTHYIFSETELTINHFFGLKETIEYKDIRSIDKFNEIGTSSWIIPIKYYYIAYPHEKKHFFLRSEISKSKKAKRLLEYYTNKEIE